MKTSVHKWGGGAFRIHKQSSIEEIRAGYTKMMVALDECDDKIVIVLSALGKTTTNLLDLIRLPDGVSRMEALAEISAFHLRVAQALRIEVRGLKKLLEALEQKIQLLPGDPSTLSQETIDEILSFGERMSVQIALDFLRKENMSIGYVSALYLIATGDHHPDGALPDMYHIQRNCRRIQSKFKKFDIVVTEGYIARNQKTDAITLLGWNGSDLTGALIAVALRCELFLYKKVEEGELELKSCSLQAFKEMFRESGLVHGAVPNVLMEAGLSMHIVDVVTDDVFSMYASTVVEGAKA